MTLPTRTDRSEVTPAHMLRVAVSLLDLDDLSGPEATVTKSIARRVVQQAGRGEPGSYREAITELAHATVRLIEGKPNAITRWTAARAHLDAGWPLI